MMKFNGCSIIVKLQIINFYPTTVKSKYSYIDILCMYVPMFHYSIETAEPVLMYDVWIDS